MTIRQRVLLRVVVALVSVGAGFVLLQYPYRMLEVWLSGGLLVAAHVPTVLSTQGAGIFFRHEGTSQLIELSVAPQCSSLPAVLAIFALATPMVPATGRRIYRSAALASAIALFGNIVRIDAVLFVGVLFGFVALVFFHTWVAAVFDFAAVLLGWVLMIRSQLGRPRPDGVASSSGAAGGPQAASGAAGPQGASGAAGGPRPGSGGAVGGPRPGSGPEVPVAAAGRGPASGGSG